MYTGAILLTAFLMSVCTIRIAMPVATRLGLVDKPGGHKQHQGHVPLVGGIAIFLSVFLAWLLAPQIGLSSINSIFVGAGGLLFVVGLLDDRFQLSVRFRFGAQIAAASLLIYGTVILFDLGFLFSDQAFTLGIFAMPLTLFCIVGAINAMNMLDGADGLAGLISLVSFSLLAVVAFISGSQIQLLIALCVTGGLCGFLVFNMPWSGRDKAQIFMGDAGSTLLGFMLAYLLISLSQGENRAISPVTALWLFAVPLMDTLGVGLRRMWHGKSPFSADRGHIHHLLQDAGFRVRHAVILIAALQLAMGGAGLIGYYLQLPELFMLIGFFGLCACYALLLGRPWRIVPQLRILHTNSGLIANGVRHGFVGGLNRENAVEVLEALLDQGKGKQEGAPSYAYEIYHLCSDTDSGVASTYALVDAEKTDKVKGLLSLLQKGLAVMKAGERFRADCRDTVIRQYINRKPENDRRQSNNSAFDSSKRQGERRKGVPQLVYASRNVSGAAALATQL